MVYRSTAAAKNGILPELVAELRDGDPNALRTLSHTASFLALKSYRWVGEMHEIAEYFNSADVQEGGKIFEGAANLFKRTDEGKDGKVGETLMEAQTLALQLREGSSK